MFMALLLLAAMTDTPAPAPPLGHQAVIDLLGSDDFDSREAAQETLVKALKNGNRSMLRPLLMAIRNQDPEIVHRADTILRQMFDPVDYGVSGQSSPDFSALAGERVYTTETIKVSDDAGTEYETWKAVRLPPPSPQTDEAIARGTALLESRGLIVGKPGWEEDNDPMNELLQKEVSQNLIRTMRVDGCSAWFCRVVSHELDYANGIIRTP